MVESCEVASEQSESLPLFILTVCQEHRFKAHNVSTKLKRNNQVSVFFYNTQKSLQHLTLTLNVNQPLLIQPQSLQL